jgi:Bacterial regulatory proteins, tetR family
LKTYCLPGAGADRLGDHGALRLARGLLQDQQRVILLELEDLRGGRHAQAIALTQVPVNDDSHVGSPFAIFRRSITVLALQAAGVTKGTFYFHFAHKEEILLELGYQTGAAFL